MKEFFILGQDLTLKKLQTSDYKRFTFNLQVSRPNIRPNIDLTWDLTLGIKNDSSTFCKKHVYGAEGHR